MELIINKIYYDVSPIKGHPCILPVVYRGSTPEGLHKFNIVNDDNNIFGMRVDQVINNIRGYDEVYHAIKHISDTATIISKRTVH